MSLPFPNVPNLPGVPQLPRLPGARNTVIAIAGNVLSGLLWQASQGQVAWGVFDSNGNQVISPDSVLEFDHRPEWRISNFPVQNGAFASYNKVKLPYEIQVRLSKGGTLADRAKFLADIDAVASSTNLYSIMTPENTYQNANIERYEVARHGRHGAYFLTEVDLYFIQIVQTQEQYSSTTITQNALNPSAVPAVSIGTVKPQSVTGSLATQAGAASRATAFGAP